MDAIDNLKKKMISYTTSTQTVIEIQKIECKFQPMVGSADLTKFEQCFFNWIFNGSGVNKLLDEYSMNQKDETK